LKFKATTITVELHDILGYLQIDPQKKRFLNEAQKALDLAYSLSHPELIYQKCSVRRESSSTFFIGDVEFHNKTLFYNLSDTNECFVYIATLGKEFSLKLQDSSAYLLIYYLDKIGDYFLHELRIRLVEHIRKNYGLDTPSLMSPGSTTLWPLSENTKLFALFGDEIDEIGVSLTEKFVMDPAKTISGIMFHKEDRFFDCLLCQIQECPGRQADYNPEIAEFYHNL
jgi:hypothetical protein